MIEGWSWAITLVAIGTCVVLMHDRGYRTGLRTTWLLFALLVPAWFFVNVRSVRVEPLGAIALTGLLWALARPFHGFRTRWVMSDLLLVGVLFSMFVSDLARNALIPGTVLDAIRMWVLPYLMGRILLTDEHDIRQPLRALCVAAFILGGLALVEAIVKTNLLATLTGMRWELLDQSEGFRWGFKRAQVTRNHPIYFGLLTALALPWWLLAFREAQQGRGPTWWLLTPVAGLGAGFFSIARSAHVALLLVLSSDLFFRRPNYRFPMLLAGAALALFLGVYYTETLDVLGRLVGEAPVGSDRVRIDGIWYDYTGTRHRELLVLAYAEAIEQAGWLGFGTTPREMPLDPYMDRRFVSIDHHYLLHYLRFGWLGVTAFVLFTVASAWNLFQVAWRTRSLEADFAGGLFGAFVAVAVLLRGIAFHEDFGALWLFIAGVGASLRAKILLPKTPAR